MKQQFQPGGQASYSPTPSSALEVFHLENMDRDPDGFWRPRWGLKYLDSYAGAITHLSAHPNGAAVMLIYNSGNLAYWVNSVSKGDLDTGWPTTPVKACAAPGASDIWLAHKAAISSDSPAGLYQVNSSYIDAAVAGAPNGTWVETHNRVLFSINSQTNIVSWSDYDDHTTWPAANDSNKMPGSITAEALCESANNRSILFGQQGLTEVNGGSDAEISFSQMERLAVAMPAYCITKCGNIIIFLTPGPRFHKVEFGKAKPISQPVAKDLRSYPSITSLRSWYDATRNYFCVTNLSTNYTHIYSIAEDKWLGFWTYGDTQNQDIVGGACLTGANDQPYSLEYVYANTLLHRWDSTLYKDELTSTPGDAVSFRCAIEAKPDNGGNQAALKRCRSIYADVSGSWTWYLKHRNTVDGAWTTTTWGSTSGPGNITAPAKYEFREWTLRGVASSASDVKFRAVTADIQIVSEAKR